VRTPREAATGLGILLVLAGLAVIVNALLSSGCYRDCDPIKEPNTCPCPPGVCGDYPQAKPKDAGADG
jgi:hypothetical protein